MFDPRGRTNTQGLKITENESTAFALQAAGPRGSDDHVKWRSRSSALNSSISTFALNALIRKESGVFCEWPPGNPLVVWFW